MVDRGADFEYFQAVLAHLLWGAEELSTSRPVALLIHQFWVSSMCGDEKGLKIRHYSGKVTDLERRVVGHPWRVHKAVSARLLVRQQLESTHEVLSRNQWRSVRPKHLSRYSLLKERATSPPVKKILTASGNPARTRQSTTIE